ncbi:type VI secretion system baseplate subunit TssF [Photorhabdus noenieputensis]|nr:type VI secretion system baseplate subunit TssF [Photorhabdus noenieputensis]
MIGKKTKVDMENFEDFYREALSQIKHGLRNAAQEHPHLAPFTPESGDPDVLRVLEGFALLTAGIKQKIDDGFPEVINPLLRKVWPIPLHPIPSTSIVQLDMQPGSMTETTNIAKGSEISAIQQNQSITFRTTQDINIEPITLIHKTLTHSENKSLISLTFQYHGPTTHWKTGPVTLFLGEDQKLASLLTKYVDQSLDNTYLKTSLKETEMWLAIEIAPRLKENLVLPRPHDYFWPLQVLYEYLYLPHVNDFMSFDLSEEIAELPLGEDKQFTIILEFDCNIPIEDITPAFIPHCVPVINLAPARTKPITFEKGKSRYVLAANEIFSIDNIKLQSDPDGASGGSAHSVPLINSAQLAACHFAEPGDNILLFNHIREESPFGGNQINLTFYDHQAKPVTEHHYREFYCQYHRYHTQARTLGIGQICIPSEQIPSHIQARNIVSASKDLPAVVNSHQHWPILSLLSIGPFFLSHIESVRSLVKQLDTFAHLDAPRSRHIQRMADGLNAIYLEPYYHFDKGIPVRGQAITLRITPENYEHEGEMYAFAKTLHTAFSLCFVETSFHRLTVINNGTNECWEFYNMPGHQKIM